MNNYLVDGVVEEDDETTRVAVGFDRSFNKLGMIMPRLTDEEYAALDEKWTRETPAVNFSRPGMFARQRLLLESLDTVAANYIHVLAETAGKTPTQIIGAMVRKEMASRLSSASVTHTP